MPLTTAEITALVNSTLLDNTSKLISPKKVRDVVNAVNEKLELDPLWVTSSNEQIVPDITTLNNLSITSNLIRFTGAGAVLTGIQQQTLRAKSLVIINDATADINIQHLSTSSSVGNRIFIPGTGLASGDNVSLAPASAIRLEYANAQWKITNWFGDGYHPTLRGTGTRAMMVLPNGKETTTETFDFRIYRPDITTQQTDSQLNTLYPGVYRGTAVVCKNISGGGIVYEKDDEVAGTWFPMPILTR